MDQNEAKLLAARAALTHLPESGDIGLGSGSTAALFIREVGKLVQAGRKLRGVPTSEESRRIAEEVGIPLLDDSQPWALACCVDGADEVSAQLDVIKGGGACHAREKIVNQAAAFNIIIVDESKMSRRLGEKWAIPVEVLAFGHPTTAEQLERFGRPVLRTKGGSVVHTDAGNPIYDLHCGPLADPRALERELSIVPGVVEVGLFLDRVNLVIIAGPDGIRELRSSSQKR